MAYVKRLASEHACTGCRFYRSEAIPAPGAVDNFGGPGPPYALIQGSLSSAGFTQIEKEGAPLVQRGDACFIGACTSCAGGGLQAARALRPLG